MNAYRLLADAVVFFHTAYVAFVVFGLLAILVGILLDWRWVRNFWFRTIHFLMIAVVVFEALGGIECPLTTLEDHLRLQAGEEVSEGTFLGRCAHGILFCEAPDWVFTTGYCLFGAAVLGALIAAPPKRPRRFRESAASSRLFEKEQRPDDGGPRSSGRG